MKYYLAIFSFVFFSYQSSVGQSGLNLPHDNPDLANEKYAILSDSHDSDNQVELDKAYNALNWIIANAPDLHESVYLFGVKLLKTKITKEPEEQKYLSELMSLYDFRIQYFGNEIKVLNRKAYDAYKYLRSDTSKSDMIVEMFDYLYQNEKEELKTNLLLPYFNLKISQLKSGKIDDKELIRDYQNISEVIQYKSDHDGENLEKIQKLIDAQLVKYLNIECDDLNNLIAKGEGENSMNPQKAKLIISLALAYGCNKEPVFFQAIKVVYEDQPSQKLASLLAAYHLNNKEFDISIIYFTQALQLTNDDNERSAVYFDMAKTYYLAGNKINARKMAYEALKFNPENLQCYRLIGDMYFNSYDECKKGKSRVKDRSVFYAAYEKYALANDKVKMASAVQQFPTMDIIHTENFEEWQMINTGCWMQENVKIRRRPDLASR